MHYFLLPMVPLTIAGALFFRKRFSAYSFPVLLTLIKVTMTRPSAVYFFTALALLTVVFLVRKMNNRSEVSWMKAAMMGLAGVFTYEVVSTLGIWMIGSCIPGERAHGFSFSGLLSAYQSALPYAGFHFLKAVPSTILLVLALQGMKRLNVALNLQRLVSGKTSV